MTRLVLPAVCSMMLLSAGCGLWEGDAPVEEEVSEVELPRLPMLRDRGERSMAAVVRDLELASHRDYADMIDLGTAYLYEGRWHEAAEAYEVAARTTSDRKELAAALYAKSAALAYAGLMPEALSTADTMAEIVPSSVEAAWLRYALYERSGDQLGLLVARDHLLRVDPEAHGEEVLDPVSAATLGTVAVVAIAGATAVSMVYLTPPEDRAEVVVPLFTAFAGIAGMSVEQLVGPDAGTPLDLGRQLVAEHAI